VSTLLSRVHATTVHYLGRLPDPVQVRELATSALSSARGCGSSAPGAASVARCGPGLDDAVGPGPPDSGADGHCAETPLRARRRMRAEHRHERTRGTREARSRRSAASVNSTLVDSRLHRASACPMHRMIDVRCSACRDAPSCGSVLHRVSDWYRESANFR